MAAAGRRGILLVLIGAALLRLSPQATAVGRRSDAPAWTWPPPLSARFSTLDLAERCQLSAWSALANTSGSRGQLVGNMWAPITASGKSVRRPRWHILLAMALSGQVELNPGPPQRHPTCLFCDKTGRPNAIRFTCCDCQQMYHSACLVKKGNITAKESQKIRAAGNFQCWKCALPALSDSFWSQPDSVAPQSPPPAPPPVSNGQRAIDKNAISIISFNARSLKNIKRAPDIAAFIDAHSADAVCINETWLSENIKSHELLPADYVVLRKDRVGGKRAAGGVILAVRPHLQPKRMQSLEAGAEIVLAEIKVKNFRLLIGSAYRQPSPTPDDRANKELLRALELIAEQQDSFDGLFLFGDFNLPNVDWQADPPLATKSPDSQFLETFLNMGLQQLINVPTRVTDNCQNVLDLLLCDVPALIASSEVVPGVSDHDAIRATLSLSLPRPTPASRAVFDFARADWDALRARLAGELAPLCAIEDVETCWQEWKRVFFAALEQEVPKKRAGGGKKLVPWMTKGLKKLIKIRDLIFNQWQKSRTQADRDKFLK